MANHCMNNLIITSDSAFSEEDIDLLSDSKTFIKHVEKKLGRQVTREDMGARWVAWDEGAVLVDDAKNGQITIFSESAWDTCGGIIEYIIELTSASKVVNTYFEMGNGFAGVDTYEEELGGTISISNDLSVNFVSEHLPNLDVPIVTVDSSEDLTNPELLHLLRSEMWDGARVRGTSDDYSISLFQAVEFIIDPDYIINSEDNVSEIKNIASLVLDVVPESDTVGLKQVHQYDISVAADTVLKTFKEYAEKEGFCGDTGLLIDVSSKYGHEPESDCSM